MCYHDDDREKAKWIIYEIIRQSGGRFAGKTRLFKAFWIAHCNYADKFRDKLEELSEWPIVRMPNGPGIHEGGLLLNELEAEGYIKIKASEQKYEENEYLLTDKQIRSHLKQDEKLAIHEATQIVNKLTARELSEWSHKNSNAWKYSSDGDTLNVYHDLMSRQEFLRMREVDRWANQVLQEIFQDDAGYS